jgi:hypothetical protein
MTNHPGKPSIQTEAWVSIYPNFYWVGYHPLKAVGTSIFTHGQACRGVTWSTKSELKFQRYWPVLYSIKRAVGPSMQGPINGIYQHNDQYKLNWDNVVNSANNNRSVTDSDLFTIRRCRIWWHSIQKRFGNLVFHEAVWDSITGKSQSALQSTQVFRRLYRTDTRSCKPTPTPCQQTRL